MQFWTMAKRPQLNENLISDAKRKPERNERQGERWCKRKLAMKSIAVSINPQSICRVCFFSSFIPSHFLPDQNGMYFHLHRLQRRFVEERWRWWWLTNTGFLKLVDSIAHNDDLNSGRLCKVFNFVCKFFQYFQCLFSFPATFSSHTRLAFSSSFSSSGKWFFLFSKIITLPLTETFSFVAHLKRADDNPAIENHFLYFHLCRLHKLVTEHRQRMNECDRERDMRRHNEIIPNHSGAVWMWRCSPFDGSTENESASRPMLREGFVCSFFGWRKEEKMKLNSVVFWCCVWRGWIMCGDWEKRNQEPGLRLMA